MNGMSRAQGCAGAVPFSFARFAHKRRVGSFVTHAFFLGWVQTVRKKTTHPTGGTFSLVGYKWCVKKLRTLRSYNELRTLRTRHMMSGQDGLIFFAMTVLNVV